MTHAPVSGLGSGDWVFVHPDERSAPPRIRGLSGRVTRRSGARATVSFRDHDGTITVELEASMLRHERRRRDRPPAYWPQELASEA